MPKLKYYITGIRRKYFSVPEKFSGMLQWGMFNPSEMGCMILKASFILKVLPKFAVVVVLFAGNGYIGVEVTPASQLYIKSGRTLSFPVQFYPIVEISLEGFHMSGIGCCARLLVIHICRWCCATKIEHSVVYVIN